MQVREILPAEVTQSLHPSMCHGLRGPLVAQGFELALLPLSTRQTRHGVRLPRTIVSGMHMHELLVRLFGRRMGDQFTSHAQSPKFFAMLANSVDQNWLSCVF